MSLDKLEVIVKCPHIDEDKPMSVYRVFTIGNMWIWLCKACWGEVVIEVKEWFSEIEVK